MDMSSGEWLSDLANEDPTTTMHHCHMMMNNHVVDNDGFNNSFFQPSDHIIFTNDNRSSINSSWSSSGQLISFESSEFETQPENKPKKELENRSKRVKNGSTYMNEHVVAERRRREKMTQGFIALSDLIPGLKKMDKASILGDAAEYLKELEERAKLLEQQLSKRIVESVYLVNRRQPIDDDNDDEFNNKTISPDDDLFEIEARILNNNFLIRIHSLNKQGLLQLILGELGKLHLTTLNCQTLPFGSYAIDITVIAQASDEFGMKTADVVKHLGKVLRQHIIALNAS